MIRARVACATVVIAIGSLMGVAARQPAGPARAQPQAAAVARPEQLVNRYCVTCHNERLKRGGLALETIAAQDVGLHADTWERVVRKLRARQMPPPGSPRPDEATWDAAVAAL